MAATEALVFDAIRTPRGKGKVNGSLHTTKPVDLVVGLMHETLARNAKLDPSRVDDVVLGCVSPVGDQGADIAKTAAIKAGLPDTVAGVQVNRFCASGLEAVNIAAQKVASGWEDLVFAGGVESMSRVPMGSDGGAWAMDPETNYDTYFIPQGVSADLIATIEGFSREDVDAYAARSQERAAAAWDEGRFDELGHPGASTSTTTSLLDKDEFIRRGTTVETLGGAEAVVRGDRRHGRLRRRRAAEVPLGREDRPRAHPGQLLGDRRRRVARDDRQRADRRRARAQARARGSSRPRSPVPTRRSCSPAPRRPAARRWRRPG